MNVFIFSWPHLPYYLKKRNQSCDFVGKKRDIKAYGEENKETFFLFLISGGFLSCFCYLTGVL